MDLSFRSPWLRALGIVCFSLALGSKLYPASFAITFFPASDYNPNTAAMDARLGISGAQIDSFESTTLLPGLTISMSGGIPSSVTLTSLANLFNVNSFSVTANNNWDGPNAAVNNPLNQLTSVSTPAVAALTTFKYAPGTTLFGIGLSNFQSLDSPSFPITNHDLFVNGVAIGDIETLAGGDWSPGLDRNSYLVIRATGGALIDSVGFQNDTGADFLVFDHLAVGGAATATPEPQEFSLTAFGVGILGLLALVRQRFRNQSVKRALFSKTDLAKPA